MAGSLWALLALIVYPAIQIPLVLFLARWFELDRDGPVPTATRAYWNGERSAGDPAHVEPHEAGRCRHCGSENDPAYTFCRACVARL